MVLPVTVVIGAILIAVLYYLRVRHLAPSEVWSWWHTFIATIVSVIFAVAIGIALFNYQTKIIDETRTQQLRTLLAIEISDTIKKLDSPNRLEIRLRSYTETVLLTYIQPLILEDAVRSGLFNSLHTEKMLQLALEMRIYNTEVSYFLSVLTIESSNPDFEHQAIHAIKNIEETRKLIIEDLLLLLKQMNLSLEPSYNTL